MPRNAKTEITFGDNTYPARLGIGELEELQEKCNAGPGVIMGRIIQGVYGDWRVQEIRETIRLGLIGGGMEPVKALLMVKRYCDPRPMAESLEPALKIITAAVVGVEDEPLGKSEAATDPMSQNFPTENSASPPSTDQPQ